MPAFLWLENVDVEYKKRVEQLEPGPRIVKEPVGRLDVELVYNSKTWRMQLLTVRVRNGNVSLSKPIAHCRIMFEDVKTYKVQKLPWLTEPINKLELPPDERPEIWGPLKKRLSYTGLTLGKGEAQNCLIGYGLETSGNFYFATDPPMVLDIGDFSPPKDHPGFLVSLPFKLLIEGEGIGSIASREITLVGQSWDTLTPKYSETKSIDEKKIEIGIEGISKGSQPSDEGFES